jgi:hypothetical protein
MQFGPVPPKKLPTQDSAKVLLLAERWQRAAWAQAQWAERAKVCVDFFEGRQWTAAQIAERTRQKRPSMKWNMIAPLVRLVIGYHGSHKTDITFRPGQDERSTEDMAKVLTQVEKAISAGCGLEWADVEVFMDGLIASRGYYDTRLDFERNDLGEAKTTALDPFAVFPDPDANTYDLNESASYVQTSKMVSIDEIEGNFGKGVTSLVRPFVMGQTPSAPVASVMIHDEITPVRTFGERDDAMPYWDQFYSLVGDFVDTHRKTIRIIDTQYKIREPRNVIIDLETGDKRTLPKNWGREQIEKALLYAQLVDNPCIVERRMVQTVHWTTMCGDMILYDAPSFYDGFTITGYFPYFRRGMTRGMVDDLIDPQMEKNKRRNAEIEIVSKGANGGWKYHQDSMTPDQKRKLQKYGSSPGFNLEWKGDHEPEPIAPAMPPMAHERLEKKADEDIRSIAGINESALGELDRVQSGRAIEARQKQAVLSIQMYMDNFKRSKMLLGDRHLNIIQNHYTEHRIYRILGENGKLTKTIINQEMIDGTSGVKRINNDVTIGKYEAAVDPTPISSTFLNAQFEEMLTLLEKMGPAIGTMMPMFADLILDLSTLPRKEEWIERIQGALGAGAPGGMGGGAPGGPGGGQPLPLPAPGGPAALTGAAPIGGNVVPFNAAMAGG